MSTMFGITLRDRNHLASILAAAAGVSRESRDKFLCDVADMLRPHAHREINERCVNGGGAAMSSPVFCQRHHISQVDRKVML
jgi:hypothetical protein